MDHRSKNPGTKRNAEGIVRFRAAKEDDCLANIRSEVVSVSWLPMLRICESRRAEDMVADVESIERRIDFDDIVRRKARNMWLCVEEKTQTLMSGENPAL